MTNITNVMHEAKVLRYGLNSRNFNQRTSHAEGIVRTLSSWSSFTEILNRTIHPLVFSQRRVKGCYSSTELQRQITNTLHLLWNSFDICNFVLCPRTNHIAKR